NQIPVRLEFLESELTEAEDRVDHLLREHRPALDVGNHFRLQPFDAGIVLRRARLSRRLLRERRRREDGNHRTRTNPSKSSHQEGSSGSSENNTTLRTSVIITEWRSALGFREGAAGSASRLRLNQTPGAQSGNTK